MHQYDYLSKSELVKILELIEQSLKCGSPDDVRDLIMSARQLFEAEFAVCGLLEAGLPHITGFVNGNYPDEWISRYMAEGLQRHDPVVRFHSSYATTQIWKDVFRKYGDPGARELLKDASDYGLKHGISSAIYVPEADKVAIVTFSDRQDRFKVRHKKIIDILSAHLNGALVRSVLSPETGAGAGTTVPQLLPGI